MTTCQADAHSLVCLVGGIAHTVLADRIPLSKISLDLIVIYSAFEVASDVIITGSLFYGLLKRKTGWMHTDRLITRLTRLMMETQTPPAVRYVLAPPQEGRERECRRPDLHGQAERRCRWTFGCGHYEAPALGERTNV